jgi:hypothetical protein
MLLESIGPPSVYAKLPILCMSSDTIMLPDLSLSHVPDFSEKPPLSSSRPDTDEYLRIFRGLDRRVWSF